jgi:CRISPR/Cas system-associated endonuclease Cas1
MLIRNANEVEEVEQQIWKKYFGICKKTVSEWAFAKETTATSQFLIANKS